jgi:low affinity Fe/Cu permease
MNERSTRFAPAAAHGTGHRSAFTLSIVLVLAWLVSSPVFHWSDTWQLYANTVTTVITFLMVFILQHTQNRDSLALHLKLDGIIKAIEGVDERLLAAEDESEERLRRQIADLRGDQCRCPDDASDPEPTPRAALECIPKLEKSAPPLQAPSDQKRADSQLMSPVLLKAQITLRNCQENSVQAIGCGV